MAIQRCWQEQDRNPPRGQLRIPLRDYLGRLDAGERRGSLGYLCHLPLQSRNRSQVRKGHYRSEAPPYHSHPGVERAGAFSRHGLWTLYILGMLITCADTISQSVENIWPNKIEYSISTPTKAVIFGTSIRVDFKLIPLLKGLGIGQIISQLVETHDLTLNPEDPDSIRNTYKTTRTIINDEHQLDGDNHLEIIDEAAEGYQFSRVLDLPKTLTRCLQDTDTRGIKIRHKLKFRVQLLNPDGHISEVWKN